MVWLEDDFPKILTEQDRLQSKAAECERLMASGALDGRDKNELRRWAESGFAGPRPTLSMELQVQWEAALEPMRQERRQARTRLEEKALEQWLEQAAQREERLLDARLRREYPISYCDWLAEQESLRRQAERARQEQGRRKVEELKRRAALEEEEQRLRLERERHRAKVRCAMRGFLIGKSELSSISAGDYVWWCEELASQDELEELNQRLAEQGRRSRLPAWRLALEDWLAPFNR